MDEQIARSLDRDVRELGELQIVRLLHMFQFVRLTQSACVLYNFLLRSSFGLGTLKFSTQGIHQVHRLGRLSLGSAGMEKTGTR